MAMHQLVIDKVKCVECGNCYSILQDKIGEFQKNKSILISDNNYNKNKEKISYAFEKCYLDAISLSIYIGE